MKRVLAAIFTVLISMQTFAGQAKAALVDAPVDAADYVVIGGIDWAWAGPCNPFNPSCGVIDMSYQSGQGWALASTAQIDAALALVGGLTAFIDLFSSNNDGAADICASRFFSNLYNHCDYSDAADGLIYNYSSNPNLYDNYFDEVFAVRVSAVPVPASLPLLLIGIGAIGALRRRRTA